MISYKLAKELKDAGYYQKSAGDRINPKGDLEYSGCWDDENEDDYVTLPTLSELIEACGGVMLDGMPEAWSACVHRGTLCVEGTSPEEAVARLWLALNKK